MTHDPGYGVLADAQWDDLAPLIAQCRPPHKTEHKNLRRTIEAIVWRHQNGAKWRSIPPHLGPWWMAAQTFICWSHHGVGASAGVGAAARGAQAGDGVPRRHHHPRPRESRWCGQEGGNFRAAG